MNNSNFSSILAETPVVLVYFLLYTFNIYCLYDIIVEGLKMILFLQVTRDKKNKKKKFFLQYTRHKILLPGKMSWIPPKDLDWVYVPVYVLHDALPPKAAPILPAGLALELGPASPKPLLRPSQGESRGIFLV